MNTPEVYHLTALAFVANASRAATYSCDDVWSALSNGTLFSDLEAKGVPRLFDPSEEEKRALIDAVNMDEFVGAEMRKFGLDPDSGMALVVALCLEAIQRAT